LELFHCFQRHLSIPGGLYMKALLLQIHLGKLDDTRFIVNNQNNLTSHVPPSYAPLTRAMASISTSAPSGSFAT
jgi:hypothetical protein